MFQFPALASGDRRIISLQDIGLSFVASGSQGIHQVPLSPFLPIDGHLRDGLILSAFSFAYTLLFLCNMS